MKKTHRYVLCIKNRGYSASLDVRKVYREMPDAAAAKDGMVRIVDESGEDYLYPAGYFVPVDVPQKALRVFVPKSA